MEVSSNEKTIAKIPTNESDAENHHESDPGVIAMSSFFNDMNWLVPVSVIPSGRPLQPMAMIQLYVNGATKRLYVFNVVSNAWSYTTLT